MILSEECQKLLREMSEQLHIPEHIIVRIALEEFKHRYQGEIYTGRGKRIKDPSEAQYGEL